MACLSLASVTPAPTSTAPPTAQPRATPGDLLAAWEPRRPLAVLWSGDAAANSRWTILAEPGETVRVVHGSGREALLTLFDRVCESTRRATPVDTACPFTCGWIGWIGYDAGRVLEPAAGLHGTPAATSLAAPLAEFHRVDRALIHDRLSGEWHALGGCAWPMGDGGDRAFHLGPLASRTGAEAYLNAAARAIEYIRAGDVYQVNLAHALEGVFKGSPRGLFAQLAMASNPWFGAYLESVHEGTARAIASLSPEQFIRFDPATRRLETCPMKGTRPAAAFAELETSEKERAELAMIVDLMRNDLGRVCELGSVRVDTARAIERHAAGDLLQATAQITGRLTPGRSLADALAQMLPGGSITGAPKIRAMQIIDELEPEPRGAYCGCIGYVSDSGHAAFNIAIRTAIIRGAPTPAGIDGRFSYSVGAGIVADSQPRLEWQETLHKAGILSGITTLPR